MTTAFLEQSVVFSYVSHATFMCVGVSPNASLICEGSAFATIVIVVEARHERRKRDLIIFRFFKKNLELQMRVQQKQRGSLLRETVLNTMLFQFVCSAGRTHTHTRKRKAGGNFMFLFTVHMTH